MIFVDASALVAIIAGEPEGDLFGAVLKASPANLTSPIAVYEAVLARNRTTGNLDGAREDVATLLGLAKIDVQPIGPAEQEAALDAFARFGRGRHPARLNMGDCFAYACAKTVGARLLYKGADFALTDIKPAV